MAYLRRRGFGLDISSLIQQTATSKGVNPAVALAIAQHESGLNPNAQNPTSSAAGLFQLINATQQQYGVTNPLDPTQNAAGGISFYSDMLKRYSGNQDLALMAYAWGPGNVDKWLSSGSVPAAQQSNFDMAQQFASYVDTNSGATFSIPASDVSFSPTDSTPTDFLSSLNSLDPVTIGVGLGILALVVWALRS